MADWLGGYWFDGDWFNPAFDEDPNAMSASLTGSASVSANLTGVLVAPPEEDTPEVSNSGYGNYFLNPYYGRIQREQPDDEDEVILALIESFVQIEDEEWELSPIA